MGWWKKNGEECKYAFLCSQSRFCEYIRKMHAFSSFYSLYEKMLLFYGVYIFRKFHVIFADFACNIISRYILVCVFVFQWVFPIHSLSLYLLSPHAHLRTQYSTHVFRFMKMLFKKKSTALYTYDIVASYHSKSIDIHKLHKWMGTEGKPVNDRRCVIIYIHTNVHVGTHFTSMHL